MKRFFTIFCLVVLFTFTIFAAPKKVAYVINGSLGDQSFYDSGYEGIKNLEKDYGVETKLMECNFDPSLYYPSLMTAARWADVVFVISYGFEEELKSIAEMFPNKIFVNIDTV
ncbi:MAG TPA: BMP family ABC transporter substrate-binding protein, partial [Defluviitoga sp.]|nr:BMP family ABC transporter substrate-binding protein [Defluviitoga sp.]